MISHHFTSFHPCFTMISPIMFPSFRKNIFTMFPTCPSLFHHFPSIFHDLFNLLPSFFPHITIFLRCSPHVPSIFHHVSTLFPICPPNFSSGFPHQGDLLILISLFHVLILLQFLAASKGQPRLALLVNTLEKAFQDIVHLSLWRKSGGKMVGKWWEKPGKHMEKPGKHMEKPVERKRKVWENWGKNDGGSMIYEEILNGFEIEEGSTNVE